MNDFQFGTNDVLDQFHNDFVSEFGGFDYDTHATDGMGETYWSQWKGNKYFNNEGENYA